MKTWLKPHKDAVCKKSKEYNNKKKASLFIAS